MTCWWNIISEIFWPKEKQTDYWQVKDKKLFAWYEYLWHWSVIMKKRCRGGVLLIYLFWVKSFTLSKLIYFVWLSDIILSWFDFVSRNWLPQFVWFNKLNYIPRSGCHSLGSKFKSKCTDGYCGGKRRGWRKQDLMRWM